MTDAEWDDLMIRVANARVILVGAWNTTALTALDELIFEAQQLRSVTERVKSFVLTSSESECSEKLRYYVKETLDTPSRHG